jgi:hypothetical protein
MKYDPHMALELGLNQDETLAYQLSCQWFELTRKILPNYCHPRIARKGDFRKSIVFKHMLKFVKENKDTLAGFQFVLFIRAQLEIVHKLQKEGKRILVDPSLLHGDKSKARWAVWKKLVKEKRQTTKVAYAYIKSNVISEFELTLKTIKDLLKDDVSIENYIKESPNILRFVILKKISPLYVVCSLWVKRLPEQIKIDIIDLSNTENLKDFDLSEIHSIYKKYFDFEN